MKFNKTPFVPLRTKFLKYSINVERDATAYSDQIAEQLSINLERYVKEIE